MVITVEIYKEIRKLRLQGLSQRKIADKLGISRNTVKKNWDGEQVPWERKAYSRSANVMTDKVEEFIRDCLREDEQCRSKKQHHTARRMSVMQESVHHTVPVQIADPVTIQTVDLQAYDTFLSRKGGRYERGVLPAEGFSSGDGEDFGLGGSKIHAHMAHFFVDI